MISKRKGVISLCLIAILYAFGVYRQLPSTAADYHDFLAYYLPAAQMLHGANPYFTSLPGYLAVADTPTWLLCFQPLAALKIHTAYWTWCCISLTALVVSLYLLIREAGFRGSDALIVAAICAMYPPIATNFWFAQSEVFLCLLLAVMLVALRRNRHGLAGFALAAAALLRAYPIGLLGYLFVLRQWKAVGWTAVGLIVGGLLTTIFVGAGTVETYVDLIGISRGLGFYTLVSPLKVPLGLLKHPANLNIGWFVKWLYDRTASRPVPTLVSILGILAEIVAVLICFRATLGIDPEDPYWRGFGLWIVTLSLISPLSWYFFLCCFLPIIVGMAEAWRHGELSSRVIYAISASYLVTTLIPSYGHPIFPITHAATLALLKSHIHIVHVLTENEFVSLILVWLAAYWFAGDAHKLVNSNARGGQPFVASDLAGPRQALKV